MEEKGDEVEDDIVLVRTENHISNLTVAEKRNLRKVFSPAVRNKTKKLLEKALAARRKEAALTSHPTVDDENDFSDFKPENNLRPVKVTVQTRSNKPTKLSSRRANKKAENVKSELVSNYFVEPPKGATCQKSASPPAEKECSKENVKALVIDEEGMCNKKCHICEKEFPEASIKRHLQDCMKARFEHHKKDPRDEDEQTDKVDCPICGRELGLFGLMTRTDHINKCIDQAENKNDEDDEKEYSKLLLNARSAVMGCPMCGKKLKTDDTRTRHLKQCALSNNMSVEQVRNLINQQREEYHNQLDAGVLPQDFRPPVKQTKLKVARKPSKLDEDLQLGMTLSTSMMEFQQLDNNDRFALPKKMAKSDAGKKSKQEKSKSLLLSLTKEEASERISDQVASLILNKSPEDELSATPSFKGKKKRPTNSDSLWSKTSFETSAAVELPTSERSSTTSSSSSSSMLFYVNALMPTITVSSILPGSKLRRCSEIPGRGRSFGPADVQGVEATSITRNNERSSSTPPPVTQDRDVAHSQTVDILAELAEENEIQGSGESPDVFYLDDESSEHEKEEDEFDQAEMNENCNEAPSCDKTLLTQNGRDLDEFDLAEVQEMQNEEGGDNADRKLADDKLSKQPESSPTEIQMAEENECDVDGVVSFKSSLFSRSDRDGMKVDQANKNMDDEALAGRSDSSDDGSRKFSEADDDNEEILEKELPSSSNAVDVEDNEHRGRISSGGSTSVEKEQCDKSASHRMLESLSSCLLSLVDNPCHSDVTIRMDQDSTIAAHKNILLARCPQLLDICTHKETCSVINLREYSKGSVVWILRYIYGGEIDTQSCLESKDEITKIATQFCLNPILVALENVSDHVSRNADLHHSKSIENEPRDYYVAGNDTQLARNPDNGYGRDTMADVLEENSEETVDKALIPSNDNDNKRDSICDVLEENSNEAEGVDKIKIPSNGNDNERDSMGDVLEENSNEAEGVDKIKIPGNDNGNERETMGDVLEENSNESMELFNEEWSSYGTVDSRFVKGSPVSGQVLDEATCSTIGHIEDIDIVTEVEKGSEYDHSANQLVSDDTNMCKGTDNNTKDDIVNGDKDMRMDKDSDEDVIDTEEKCTSLENETNDISNYGDVSCPSIVVKTPLSHSGRDTHTTSSLHEVLPNTDCESSKDCTTTTPVPMEITANVSITTTPRKKRKRVTKKEFTEIIQNVRAKDGVDDDEYTRILVKVEQVGKQYGQTDLNDSLYIPSVLHDVTCLDSGEVEITNAFIAPMSSKKRKRISNQSSATKKKKTVTECSADKGESSRAYPSPTIFPNPSIPGVTNDLHQNQRVPNNSGCQEDDKKQSECEKSIVIHSDADGPSINNSSLLYDSGNDLFSSDDEKEPREALSKRKEKHNCVTQIEKSFEIRNHPALNSSSFQEKSSVVNSNLQNRKDSISMPSPQDRRKLNAVKRLSKPLPTTVTVSPINKVQKGKMIERPLQHSSSNGTNNVLKANVSEAQTAYKQRPMSMNTPKAPLNVVRGDVPIPIDSFTEGMVSFVGHKQVTPVASASSSLKSVVYTSIYSASPVTKPTRRLKSPPNTSQTLRANTSTVSMASASQRHMTPKLSTRDNSPSSASSTQFASSSHKSAGPIKNSAVPSKSVPLRSSSPTPLKSSTPSSSPSLPMRSSASTPHRLPPSTLLWSPPSTPLGSPPSTPHRLPPSTPHRLPPSTPHRLPPSTPHRLPPSTPHRLPHSKPIRPMGPKRSHAPINKSSHPSPLPIQTAKPSTTGITPPPKHSSSILHRSGRDHSTSVSTVDQSLRRKTQYTNGSGDCSPVPIDYFTEGMVSCLTPQYSNASCSASSSRQPSLSINASCVPKSFPSQSVSVCAKTRNDCMIVTSNFSHNGSTVPRVSSLISSSSLIKTSSDVRKGTGHSPTVVNDMNDLHTTTQPSSPLSLRERLGLTNPFGAKTKDKSPQRQPRTDLSSQGSKDRGLKNSANSIPVGTKARMTCPQKRMEIPEPAQIKQTVSPGKVSKVKSVKGSSQHNNSKKVNVKKAPTNATPERTAVPRIMIQSHDPMPSPFTPMAPYDTMNTPELKKAIGKVGMRPMGKKRMRNMLKHIYTETHQYETDGDDVTPVKGLNSNVAREGSLECGRLPKKTLFKHSSQMRSQETASTSRGPKSPSRDDNSGVKTKKTLSKTSGRNYSKPPLTVLVADQQEDREEDILSSQDSSFSDGPDVPEESMLQALPEEDDMELPCTQLTQTSMEVLNERLMNFLRDNPKIYEQILMYEALELDVLKKQIADAGIRVGYPRLQEFLDERCITFSMKNMSNRNNRQRLQKKKKGNSPAKRKKVVKDK